MCVRVCEYVTKTQIQGEKTESGKSLPMYMCHSSFFVTLKTWLKSFLDKASYMTAPYYSVVRTDTSC